MPEEEEILYFTLLEELIQDSATAEGFAKFIENAIPSLHPLTVDGMLREVSKFIRENPESKNIGVWNSLRTALMEPEKGLPSGLQCG